MTSKVNFHSWTWQHGGTCTPVHMLAPSSSLTLALSRTAWDWCACVCTYTPACTYKHHPYHHKQASLGYYLDLGMLSSLVWSTLGREGQERGLLWERKWLRVILAGNSRVQLQDTWSCRRNAGYGWACTLDSGKPCSRRRDMVREGQGSIHWVLGCDGKWLRQSHSPVMLAMYFSVAIVFIFIGNI